MHALVVSLYVKPDMRERFLAAAEDDSTCSVRDEPGCLRFDVLEDEADPNHFFFYEIYTDAAAIDAHRQAPHYARWDAAAKEVLDPERRSVTRATTVFPANYS
jgi:autoinducer 2-degrading protein